MRILVTGATGNVGRSVVTALRARGGAAICAAVSDPARADSLGSDVEPRMLDFRDPATFAAAAAGCDAVFLLRPPPISDMKRTLNPFIDAARRAGVSQVVFLSVTGADTMRWVPHHGVEKHLVARGGAFTILRPGFFAQNLADAYRRDIVEDGRLFVPAGRGRVAFVDARDLGEAAAVALVDPTAHAQKAYTLTGPEAIDFAEVAALLSTALGRTIAYQPASIVRYAAHLRRKRGLPWMQVAVQTVLHVGIRRGDAEKVDSTLATLIGRQPRALADYIRDHVAVFR